MYRVKLGSPPALNKVSAECLLLSEKLVQWTHEVCPAMKVGLKAVYLRGSSAHGCNNHYSDIDFVVLVENNNIDISNELARVLKALVGTYLWSLPVEIKVLPVNEANEVEMATNNGQDWDIRVKKHVNFDLAANGICLWGNSLEKQIDVYGSPWEFEENNRLIWGYEIKEFLKSLCCDNFFNHHYLLIKKCIRLAAYYDFRYDSLYYGTTQECFDYILKREHPFKKQISWMYQYLLKPAGCDVEKLKEHMRKVASYLLIDYSPGLTIATSCLRTPRNDGAGCFHPFERSSLRTNAVSAAIHPDF